MQISGFSLSETEVIKRAMEATFDLFSDDYQTRLSIAPEEMRSLLNNWSNIDGLIIQPIALIAINNALNEVVNGIGLSDDECLKILGASALEVSHIFTKWYQLHGK